MKHRLFSFLAIVGITLLSGCYPNGPEYVDEYDVVATNYDTAFDFKTRGTYSLPDKIVIIDGDPTDVPTYIKDINGTQLLTPIDANMQGNGCAKVDVNSNPDVQLLPASWSTTTIVGGYYGGYWCWYYYYYCGGGGWYYPYPYYSSYSTGTLIITMVDAKSDAIDGSKTVRWTAGLNGLLGDTNDVVRAKNGINQAFKQSPYLKIK